MYLWHSGFLRLVRARRRMNEAEKYETSSAFVSRVGETIAFPSVATERRSRQIEVEYLHMFVLATGPRFGRNHSGLV